jgi:uncharacterized membrane protein (DUF4010 family)
MNDTEILLRLGVALAAGLAIGVERGSSHPGLADGTRAAGVRTFAFLALIGAACGLSTAFAGPWLLAAVGLGVIGFLISAYRAGLRRTPDLGLTTEMAGVATFVAGALSGAGYVFATVLTAAAAIVLLHNKPALHALTDRIVRSEIDAAAKILALAVLALPLAPDKGYGPGEALNPRALTLAAVVIAALGFAGYSAIRMLGGRLGILAFGFFGGLVSSTGVALGAARLARDAPGHVRRLASATSIAQALMFVRTGFLAGALNPTLLPVLAGPLLAGALSAALAAYLLLPGKESGETALPLQSPDTVNTAVRFVALAAGLTLVAALVQAWLGAWGLYASVFLAGLADADAATVTAARLPDSASSGAFAVILGLTANSAAKTVIVWRQGGPAMGTAAGTVFLVSALAMVSALIVWLAFVP